MKKGIDYVAIGICAFCHDGNGNFVMLKRGIKARDEHGKWDIIGGGIEFGDTPEETLRKEIKEELDADVLDFEFLGFLDVHREHEGQPTHWVQLAFKALVDPKQVKIHEPHKFDDLKWVTLDTIPLPRHSQFPNFLNKFEDKLKTVPI